jgi:hypothetical protein
MLMDYINAVNRGEFDAYAYWTNPAQTYTDFANGWVQTTETILFYGGYQPGSRRLKRAYPCGDARITPMEAWWRIRAVLA